MRVKTIQLLHKLFGMTVKLNDGKIKGINFFN